MNRMPTIRDLKEVINNIPEEHLDDPLILLVSVPRHDDWDLVAWKCEFVKPKPTYWFNQHRSVLDFTHV